MNMIVALLSCLGICTCMVRVYDDSQMEYLRATNLYIADRATEIPVKITTVDKIIKYDIYRNLQNLIVNDAYFVPVAPEGKNKVYERSIKFTEENRVAFLYAVIDLVCDPDIRSKLVYIKLHPPSNMIFFRFLEESVFELIFSKPEFKDLQTYNHINFTNAKTPIDGDGPNGSVYDNRKSLKLHLVTKSSEPFDVIQVYKDTKPIDNLMEQMSFDALLRMRFVRSQKALTATTIPSNLVYLKFRSIYPALARPRYNILAASHMKLVLDLLELNFRFLGHKFYPNLDLLRETFVEMEHVDGSNEPLYWVLLGFDKAITEAQLDVISVHLKIRLFGQGVIEESFKIMTTECLPVIMNFAPRKGTVKDVVVHDFEEFQNLLTTRYDPKKLGRQNTMPIVFQTSGETSGPNYMIISEFFCTREDLIAMLLVRLYYIISKTIILENPLTQIQLILLQPCGQTKYQMTASFSGGNDREATEMVLRLQLCLEILLVGMGCERIKIHPGKVVPSSKRVGFGSDVNAKLTISASDYKVLFERIKIVEPPKQTTSKLSKRAARKLSQCENMESSQPKQPSTDHFVATIEGLISVIEAQVDVEDNIGEIAIDQLINSNDEQASIASEKANLENFESKTEILSEAVEAELNGTADGGNRELARTQPVELTSEENKNLDISAVSAKEQDVIENLIESVSSIEVIKPPRSVTTLKDLPEFPRPMNSRRRFHAAAIENFLK